MKVDSGANCLYATQRPQTTSGDFSSPLATPTIKGAQDKSVEDAAIVKQTDFANMTRQDLRDWTNTKIRNGEMSLDDGFPFVAMTMKIPASGEYGGEISAATETEQFNFSKKVSDGIDGALSRNDTESLKMLQAAMCIMQKYQGQTVGIDVRI